MKTKQLANILLKVLGVFFLLTSLPFTIVQVGEIIQSMQLPPKNLATAWNELHYPMAGLCGFVINLLVFLFSHRIAGFLFKGEEE